MPSEGAYPRPMQALTTAWLTLMPWQDAFGEDLARLASDECVMRYIGNGRPWSRQQALQRHRPCLKNWDDHDFGWRAILDRPANHFLGLAALNYLGALVPGIEESTRDLLVARPRRLGPGHRHRGCDRDP